MMHYLSGKTTGIYYADSTHFAVCKNIRIARHKTFDGLAARGHSSIDWFYGLKLYMIINEHSEIVAVKITKGNVDDRKAFEEMAVKKGLQGKCYADKGFISKELFKRLYQRGFIIETIFGYLKENFNLKTNKHRSPINFFVTLLAALIAFQIKPNKPKISYP